MSAISKTQVQTAYDFDNLGDFNQAMCNFAVSMQLPIQAWKSSTDLEKGSSVGKLEPASVLFKFLFS